MIKSRNRAHEADNKSFTENAGTSGHGFADDVMNDGDANMAGIFEAGGDNTAETSGASVSEAQQQTDQQQAKEWQDKYLRLSAEFDNYRKRTSKEKMEIAAYGGEDVLVALLPVLDDIDRALEVVKTATDVDSVRTGTELIAHKLRGLLENRGVKEIEAKGTALDTDFHEAVAKIPAPDDSTRGKIVDVVQKGYKLKDKVIRHAKVVVGE